MLLRLLLFTITGSVLLSQESVGEFYRLGAEAQRQGNYYSAIEHYRTALTMNPHYLEPIIGSGECYFALGEYEEAYSFSQRARRYAGNSVEVRNMEGRILLGLGRFEEAEVLFRGVLEEEPYNMDAQFGMAEREIAVGNVSGASSRYREALRASPDNRRALLSLILLYDDLGSIETSEGYVAQALHYYSNLPEVRWIAARHYARAGRMEKALENASVAHELAPDHLDSGVLLVELQLGRDDPQKAIEISEVLLSTHRDSSVVWYLLGVAKREIGDIDGSIYSHGVALSLEPGNDAIRVMLESTLLEETPLGDERREKYASYHISLGEEYEDLNLIAKATAEYRRGIQLSPYSVEGRKRIGSIYQRRGFLSRYLEELLVVENEGGRGVEISDEMEIMDSNLSDSVATRWGIEQFLITRQEYPIGLFFVGGSTVHYGLRNVLLKYGIDTIHGVEHISVVEAGHDVAGFSEAFRRSREIGATYFLTIEIIEGERTLLLRNKLYVAATGGLLTEWDVFRTGNHRIPEGFRRIAQDLSRMMIPYGVLVERHLGTGVVDLGRMDGVEPGARYRIVPNGAWQFKRDGYGFLYAEEDVVGEMTVTAVDDLVSEGELASSYFFDTINQGDALLPIDEEAPQLPSRGMSSPPGFYDLLLKID